MARTLVAYYSHTGHTEKMANTIGKELQADVVLLEPKEAYTEDYKSLVAQSLVEIKEQTCPELKEDVDVKAYDTIFIGSPNWCGTYAGPIRTFLRDMDLSGKRVIPFGTNGGGGFGNTQHDVEKACKEATVEQGFSYGPKSNENDLKAWLEGLGF